MPPATGPAYRSAADDVEVSQVVDIVTGGSLRHSKE